MPYKIIVSDYRNNGNDTSRFETKGRHSRRCEGKSDGQDRLQSVFNNNRNEQLQKEVPVLSTKRPFVPEDLYRFVLVGDPQIHPDGDVVVFVRSHVEGEKKELRSHIWVKPTEGDTPARPYTRGPKSDSQPRWSPDGRRLAFVRQTGEGPDAERQIWIIERDGGEAWQLTSMRHGAGNPIWSPDGRRIAFVAGVGDDETTEEAMTAKTAADRKKDKRKTLDEARRITRFRYKFDHGGLLPPRRSHVWVVTVPEEPPAPGVPFVTDEGQARAEAAAAVEDAALSSASTPGSDFHDHLSLSKQPRPQRVTTEPFDHMLLDFSPDGRYVAVSASYEDEREPVSDIWIFEVPADDDFEPVAQAPVNLTGGSGVYYAARWSPDGNHLAVIGHRQEHKGATLHRIWLYPAPGREGKPLSEPVCLTADWDRGVGGTVNSDVRPGMAGSGLTWAPQGDALYFVADDRGRSQVYKLRLDTALAKDEKGKSTLLPEVVAGGPAEVYGFSLSKDGHRAAMAIADMFNPGDIYVVQSPDSKKAKGDSAPSVRQAPSSATAPVDGFAGPEAPGFYSELSWSRRRLTAVNEALLARIDMPAVEEIQFPSFDGLTIHGWMMRPVNAEESEKAPAVLQIHGGPHTCWGHSFSLEMHLLTALGYAVIFVNPRGSTSYGQQFTLGCVGDYGGADYKDLMAAVDYAIGIGGIDEERLAVTGGSYGGFMTNWIVTQTDRFRAAISHRSISNWISFWGVSDIGPRFMDSEFGAKSLWAGFDDMWERSPLKHAQKVVTPLLICHSEHDLRCPMEQAEQFYLALKWEGKTVELLRHPRSNHDLTRTGPPTLRVDRFHHIARFLAEHVSNDLADDD